jgi:hypothetical protein
MADIDVVRNNFQALVTAFNSHIIANVIPYLDLQASVYSISDRLGYFPRHAVRAYFEEQFKDNPNFQPDHIPPPIQFNPTLPVTGAIITDTATWTETRNGVPNNFKIIYTFTLVKRGTDPNSVWTFTSLWGA